MKMRTECDGRVRFFIEFLSIFCKRSGCIGVSCCGLCLPVASVCRDGHIDSILFRCGRRGRSVSYVRSGTRNAVSRLSVRATAGRERVRHSEPNASAFGLLCLTLRFIYTRLPPLRAFRKLAKAGPVLHSYKWF